MELTPQLLTDEIDFRIAVRGYDRHEVDDFLERVAVAVGQLQSQLAKAVARAKTAEARVAELEAGGAVATPTAGKAPKADKPAVADEATKQAKPAEKPAATSGDMPTASEAPKAVEATPEPLPSRSVGSAKAPLPVAPPAAPVAAPAVIGTDEDLNEELRRTLVLAQRTADTAIREAHEEARAIIERANEEARRNRDAADEAHAKAREEARGRLVAEIRELEATREALRADTVVLDRYLGAERARVRESIQVLRRLVDDPDSFKAGPPPELSGVTAPTELESESTSEPEPTPEPPADIEGDDAGEPEVAADEVVEAPAEAVEVPAEPAEAAPAETDASSATSEPEPEKPSELEERAADTPKEDLVEDAASTADVTEAPAHKPEPQALVSSEVQSVGQLFASSDASKDWRSAGEDRGDQGPHTQPVAAARFEEESDEAFLAELRRAMSDDEPLGPGEN